jgi:hypothetical protein
LDGFNKINNLYKFNSTNSARIQLKFKRKEKKISKESASMIFAIRNIM